MLTEFPPQVQKKISDLPEESGVYLMMNVQGKIIYIGKAKNLKNRVRTYFNGIGDGRRFIRHLAEILHDIHFLITPTEKDALLLESSLIKKHQPQYNISLKEDRSYCCLRANLEHDYPHYVLVPKYKKGESLYLGPFDSRYGLKTTLYLMQKFFPLRTCTDSEFKSRTRPCMDYEIGKCCAPCVGYVSKEDYQTIFQKSLAFLQGQSESVLTPLTERMNQYAEKLEFEEAAKIRDQINAVTRTLEKRTLYPIDSVEQDILGICTSEELLVFKILNLRQGNIVHSDSVVFKGFLPDPLSSFIRQYYSSGKYIPDKIVIPEGFEDQEAVQELLTEWKKAKVLLVVPKKGPLKKLVEMANRNATLDLKYSEEQEKVQLAKLVEIQKKLQLTHIPRVIECFDNSNLQGSAAVGAMVQFKNGEPYRRGYRKFKIKTVFQPDDFASMEEVLTRRYSKLNSDEWPNLVVIDGGKGQLSAAQNVFEKLQMNKVDLVSLAKARLKKDQNGQDYYTVERIFKPEASEPIVLDQQGPENLFLCRIRDEAHRFAITYHRVVRKNEMLKNGLESIQGVGKKRQKQLLQTFKSIRRLTEASQDEIELVPGFSKKLAETVYQFLHRQP